MPLPGSRSLAHRTQPGHPPSAEEGEPPSRAVALLRCSFLLGNRFPSILCAWGSPALQAEWSQAHSLPLILTRWGEKCEPCPHTHRHVVPHGPSGRASLSLQNTRAFSKSQSPLWNVATPPLGLSQTPQTGIQASGGGSGEGEMLKYPSISNHPPTLLHDLDMVTPSVM